MRGEHQNKKITGTEKEKQVKRLRNRGLTWEKIAKKLNISTGGARYAFNRDYHKGYYKKHKEWITKRSVNYRKTTGFQQKLKIIKALGGKCQRCGYNKNIHALCLHHKSGKKEHALWYFFKEMRERQSLNDIELLCANCHAEVHHPETS